MTDEANGENDDDYERWQTTRVFVDNERFDLSKIDPQVRSLGLLKPTEMPTGPQLAALEHLESLVINGGTAERIDLRGCRNLRHLMVSYVRGLTELSGLEDLTALEELDIYAQPQITVIPSLHRLTKLWRVDLGSLKGLTTGLAPFLAAPNLREIDMQSTFPIAEGDAELLRDHPRVVGFTWFDARGTSAADVRHLHETAGRRLARMRKEGPPAENEAPPQALDAAAPEHMIEITVGLLWDGGGGGVHPISGLGDALLNGEFDYGSGLQEVRIVLCMESEAPSAAKVRLFKKKEALSIEQPSALTQRKLFRAEGASPALLEQGAHEVIAALEAARDKIAREIPTFNIDALLQRCIETSSQLPATPDAVDALIESAENQARALRAAMHRRNEQAGNEAT